MTNHPNRSKSRTLAQLVEEHSANAFTYCDAGNGSGFGREGQMLDYDDDAAAKYGQVKMRPTKTGFASEWIVTGDGSNPYRYRIVF